MECKEKWVTMPISFWIAQGLSFKPFPILQLFNWLPLHFFVKRMYHLIFILLKTIYWNIFFFQCAVFYFMIVYFYFIFFTWIWGSHLAWAVNSISEICFTAATRSWENVLNQAVTNCRDYIKSHCTGSGRRWAAPFPKKSKDKRAQRLALFHLLCIGSIFLRKPLVCP